MKHCVMFESCGDDVFLPFAGADHRRGTDRLVVGFGAAGSESDLTRQTAQHGSHPLTGVSQRFVSTLSDRMQAGRISVDLFHIREHRVDRGAAHFCCRGIICVNFH